jgi:hypothetical protein
MRGKTVRGFGLLAVLVIPPLLAACTFEGSQEKAATAPATTTMVISKPQRAFVRRCETSVYGRLDAPAWRKHSVTAGPLVFYYADQYAGIEATQFDAVSGRSGYYRGQKLLILVRRGAVATVAVTGRERRHAALLYDPAHWNDSNQYRVSDGESAVTFKACRQGETAPIGGPARAMTQFNGGFVVAGVRCLALHVFVRGDGRPIPVRLSFGAGRCA